jgi:DNA primase
MRIPDSKIDEVRSASDVVDVISSYVRLKKRGKNFIGLCPFHQEKTPSFNVSPDKQMYYCFGCGNGGNVITFITQFEKVSFIEAVRTLAERAGITLPSESSADVAEATESEKLYDVCRKAGLHFYENLTTTIEGKLALEYFHHRGFTDETIRKFGLGYAMNSWDDLMKRMERENVPAELLDKAGLVVKREDAVPPDRQGTGYYDRFRGRAMFPIFSPSGRTIAFGARKMREDDPLGKYINSPETPIYNKSRNLYGLFQAKEAIREKEFVILVEGYADLISVFQAGIHNIVASSGTALTEEQIQLTGRYAKNIVLVYDADSAGSKATMRGVDLIIEQGLEVKVAELPQGEDPDSFVKKHGGEAFQKLLDDAASFLDFKVRSFQSEGLLNTPDGQTRAVRSIVETIAKMKDELKRTFYIKSVSEKYRIYESVLYGELERILGHERTRAQFAQRRDTPPALDETKTEQVYVPPAKELSSVERDLLKLMLEHGNEMVGYVFSHIERESFTHAMAKRLVQLILQYAESGRAWDANTLISDVDDADFRRFVAALVFSKYEISKGWEEMGSAPEEPDPGEIAERCFLIMRRQQLDDLLKENQQKMKEAAARGEPAREYLEHHHTLLNQKKELEKSAGKKVAQ